MKTILKSYKYRLYPNKQQEDKINKTIGCCRFIYNYYLAKKIELYNSKQIHFGYNNCANDLKNLKKEYKWLKEVDSISLQQTLRDLDQAYQKFFKKEKRFPNFKSKKNRKQSYRTQLVGTNIQIIDNKIKLPKLGLVKFVNSKQFDGKLMSCTITKTKTNKYFVSVLVEEQIQKLSQNNNIIGFDLGLKDFLIDSNGDIFNNPRILEQYEKKLIKLQRQLASKEIGSKRYKKQSLKIAKLYERIANKRNDFLQKLSTQIINDNQVIISEDLDVENMMKNHRLAKGVYNASWSKFTRMIMYKSIWNGKIYHKINRYYASSQICSNCGYKNIKVKNLGVREWECPQCNTYHNRDINAAINIKNQGLKELGLIA